ncbi:MAG: hypothetical protein HRU38_14540 [Saccharospirillaceae bacterium]|nr:hypothetical protein [Pseudomonadales bacterium]NRB79861.1 hypothetical protein [Saccharospirillaceae bacterium]
MARELGRLSYEHHNNGNINWNDSFIQLADWLIINLPDKTIFTPVQIIQMQQDLKQIKTNGTSGRAVKEQEEIEYTHLKESIVKWCK